METTVNIIPSVSLEEQAEIEILLKELSDEDKEIAFTCYAEISA